MIYLKNQPIPFAYIGDEDSIQECKSDFIRIQKALFCYCDIYCTLEECNNIWLNYSKDVQEVWIEIPIELENIIGLIETSENFVSYEDWCL